MIVNLETPYLLRSRPARDRGPPTPEGARGLVPRTGRTIEWLAPDVLAAPWWSVL
jgi:hypothetical protein